MLEYVLHTSVGYTQMPSADAVMDKESPITYNELKDYLKELDSCD